MVNVSRKFGHLVLSMIAMTTAIIFCCFSFIESDTPAYTILDKIIINNASESSIVRLSGIGDTLAERIIEYRIKHGDFILKSDIQNVKGIGPGKMNMINDKINLK